MCKCLSIFLLLICFLYINSVVTTSNDSYIRGETIIEVQNQHNSNVDNIKVDDYIPDFIRIKFDSLYKIHDNIKENITSSHDSEPSSHKNNNNNKSKDGNYNNNNKDNDDSNINNENDIGMKTKYGGNDDKQYDNLFRSSSRNKDGSSNDNNVDDIRYYYNDGNKKLHDDGKINDNYDNDYNSEAENKRRNSDHKHESNTNTAKKKHNDNNDESIQDNEESIQDSKKNNNNNIDDNDDKRFKSTKSNDRVDVDYEEEIRIKQHAETLRLRKIREREIEGEKAVKRTIQAGSSEQCDWRSQPLAIIKGEVCGSHYKVLGIERKNKSIDKNSIKKKYRQLSLSLHPDKNPSDNAEIAFHVLQESYNCLLDDNCKNDYDNKLVMIENEILYERQKLKNELIEKSIFTLRKIHYYISYTANHIYHSGIRFWDIVGEWKIKIMGENYPIGRCLALLLLIWKGQFLLQLQLLSYIIIRVNYEVAKAQGWI